MSQCYWNENILAVSSTYQSSSEKPIEFSDHYAWTHMTYRQDFPSSSIIHSLNIKSIYFCRETRVFCIPAIYQTVFVKILVTLKLNSKKITFKAQDREKYLYILVK